MPGVYEAKCRSCDYAVRGVRSVTCVVMDDGSETICEHPLERRKAEEATGKSWEELVESNRIVLRHALLCLACGHLDYYIPRMSSTDAQGNVCLPGTPHPSLISCPACGKQRLHPLHEEIGPLRRLLQLLGLFRERVVCPKCRKGLLRFECIAIS